MTQSAPTSTSSGAKWALDWVLTGLFFGCGFTIAGAVINFVVGILQQHK
jgi:hypothetical protein